jgi:CDP-glycerol glycerophosphotransferase (TagB/SpsB family)
MTNEWCAKRDREAYPDRRVVTCGSPKLDAVFGRKWTRRNPPVIGYTTHWDAHTVPETRSSFTYYREALRLLAGQHRVIAHTHPRSIPAVWSQFSALGLDTIRDMWDFFEAVDLLVCDVGSAPYEFAATGRPVVVCNCPLYRRAVNHGLRFWEDIPGLQVDEPRQLADTVRRALDDPPEARALREAAVASVYPNAGEATRIAVDAIEDWINGR